MSFDLRQLVEDVLTDTSLNDPRELAAEVLKRTPAKSVRDAYAVALVDFVRHASINETRHNPILNGKPPRVASAGYSHKRAAIRDAYARALQDRVFVEPDTWKPLGECTFDDLMGAAVRRRELAEHNIEAAQRYERLAKLLEYHEAATVADLPQETFESLGDDDA